MAGVDRVAILTIAVRDQEEALKWFTEKLDFEKRLDIVAPGIRWLTIAPREQREVEFVLASWLSNFVGRNAPCVVETQDCHETFAMLEERGVTFTQAPKDKPYGVEAVFEDLYGNSYALVERKQ